MFVVMDFIQFAQDAATWRDLSVRSMNTKCCVDSLYIVVGSKVNFISFRKETW
jgi:hypothetical protein